MKRLTISKYIALLIISIGLLISIVHTFLILTIEENNSAILTNVIPILFGSMFFALTFFSDDKLSKWIQIIVLYAASGIATYSSPNSFYGVGFMLIATIAFYKQKLLFKRAIFNFLFFLPYISVLTCSYVKLLPSKIYNTIDLIIFMIMFFCFLYLIFETELQELQKATNNLTHKISNSEQFHEQGLKIGGLVHNLKSDMSMINMVSEKSSIDGEHNLNAIDIDVLKKATISLQERINKIMYVMKAHENQNVNEVFNINRLIHSIIEFFQADLGFKRKVKIIYNFYDEINVYNNIGQITQMFENIIKNSYEAIVPNGVGELTITIMSKLNRNYIIFSDNGIGYDVCANCHFNKNCIDEKCFRVGKTTKENGTGFGMVFVKNTMKLFREPIIRIRSQRDNGFTISLSFLNEKGVKSESTKL